MPETELPATDLDLISFLKAIPDARMRRGIRIPAWYLLLVAVLGILSGCQSLRDLERFAIRHHSVLTEALGIELRRPPSDSAFRYFFRQVDVAALCAAIRDWTIAQCSASTPLAAWRQSSWPVRGTDRPPVVAGDNRGAMALEATSKTKPPIAQSHCQHWDLLIGTRRQPRWPVGCWDLC